jgi:putative transposase
MKMLKAFKFRLKTNSTTSVKLASIAGSNRFIWNWALAVQKKRLENKEYIQNYAALCSALLEIKNDEVTAWLKDCPSQTLQQSLKNLERALKDAFNKKSPKKFPQFKKKGQNDSFRYPQGIKVSENRVFLPKIGWVGFFKSRDIIGIIKNATISKKGEHWFVSIQTEIEAEKPVHRAKSAIGVDLGVKKFSTLSDGRVYEAKNSFKKRQARLAKLQQRLSKKKKGSSNFKELKKRINKLHTKIANIRTDYLHQVSTDISKNHALVVLEDLKVANMSKSASGTLEEPGKMVAAKSGLNRSILDQGWHSFKSMLSYKMGHLGGELLLVDPRYTSQKCSSCGHTEKENRLSQAHFACLQCGHKENADVNAAKNVLAAGHAVLSLSSEVALAA